MCNANEVEKNKGLRPTDKAMYGRLALQRLQITDEITKVLTEEKITWIMAAPGPMPEWIATHKNKGVWASFKNFHASFFAATQQAKKDGNEALEDRLLTTAAVAAKLVFWSTSNRGFSNDLHAQMVRRIDLFGKDPTAAINQLAKEFIRSAVTKKVMTVMTPEMVASNRYRRTAEAARNGNLSKAGAVLEDDSLRSDLAREEVLAELEDSELSTVVGSHNAGSYIYRQYIVGALSSEGSGVPRSVTPWHRRLHAG